MKSVKYLLIFLTSLFCINATAYYSLVDTAEILGNEQYTFTGESQWVTSGENGLNFRGHLDQGLTDSSQMRFTLGTGVNRLQAGFFYKWVPIPDFGDQPGFGIIYGAMYSKIDGDSVLGIRLKLVSSKIFRLNDDSIVKPYGGLASGLSVTSKKDLYPLQVIVGSQYRPPQWKTVFLMAEAAWGSNDAFSYLSFGLQWDFSEKVFDHLNENVEL